MARAVLRTIAGEVLGELKIECEWLDFMKQVGAICALPPCLHRIIKILYGSEVLVDHGQLAFHQPADEPVDLTVTFSMEELHQNLQQRSASSTRDVVSGLIFLVQKVGVINEFTMNVVAECFSHEDSDVRKAVVNLFIEGGKRGDMRVVDMMLAKIGHTSETVVASATAVLGHAGPKLLVVERLRGNTKHPSTWVRRQTLSSLALVARKGDRDTIVAIAGCLDDSCHTVRFQAVKALTQLADNEDPTCISDLIQILSKDDKHIHVKAALAEAHAQLSSLKITN